MHALAAFHVAASTFPLSQPREGVSPGVAQRYTHLSGLLTGDMTELIAEVQWKQSIWPELATRARRLGELFMLCADDVLPLLAAAKVMVPIQSCIRDIWHDHMLFQGDEVSGIVDFGATRPENVAGDVARLVGSLVEDDANGWRVGLAAYQTIRPLLPEERLLVRAFDESSVLLAAVKWMEWVFREEREFADSAAVLRQIDGILRRLARRTTDRSSGSIKIFTSDRAEI
jgi:Ser/Thr protein kinase RdoA (MazF antagonist)